MVDRIVGLASGMDTDLWVEKLMNAHRIPMDKLVQNKQLLEWQRDDYREINKKILELRTSAFDMKLSQSFAAHTATSADGSAVGVSASGTAIEGSYTLKVTQLAKAASLTSTAIGASDSGATLASLGLTQDTTLTVSGQKGTVTVVVKTTDTLDGLMRTINHQTNTTGVSAIYDETLDHIFFVSGSTGSASKVGLGSTDATLIGSILHMAGTSTQTAVGQTVTGVKSFASSAERVNAELTANQTFRIAYDGVEHDFTISASTTLDSLTKMINSSDLGKAGVSAYLNANGKLAFSNADDAKTLVLSDETPDGFNVLHALGWQDEMGADTTVTMSDQDITGVAQFGLDANIEFNGVAGSYATNAFVINGIQFTAKQVTADAINISVSKDVDTVFHHVKTFVDKYNEMIDLLNDKLNEKRYRDFQPLTEEQKKEMKEDDIKKWNEKAMSGMLHSDDLLRKAVNMFRTAMSDTVDSLPHGTLRSLADIGISSNSWHDLGHLYIDETKLRKAISEKPDEVQSLFTQSGEGGMNGVAIRLYDQANALIDQITAKAGKESSVDASYTMGKKLNQYQTDMENLQRRLDDLQTRYYNQFSMMEMYINRMNQQSNFLASQFGMANNS